MGTDFQSCRMKKFWSFVAQQCEYTGHNRYAQVKTIKIVKFHFVGVFFSTVFKKTQLFLDTVGDSNGQWFTANGQWTAA